MKAVIDTSSFLSLVRYYLPFDTNNRLFDFIKLQIESNNIIILDLVIRESQYTSKGIILDKLDFLKSKKIHVNTTDLLPSKKFFNQLENQFINGAIRNKLDDVEFDNRKNAFLNSADAKLILYAIKHSTKDSAITIVTEETEVSNDNKSFKKIPAICSMLDIPVSTLPELLGRFDDINFEFK